MNQFRERHPVMIVPIRRILLPTDFSPPAKEAAEYAMAFADRFGAELHLFHVVPQVMPYDDASGMWITTGNETEQLLEAAEEQLRKNVLDPQWSAEHPVIHKTILGFAVDEILMYAKENDIDLIVMGTHGYSWLAHMLIGSVAEKVVRMATCPVLTIHPTGHQFVVDTGVAVEARSKG